MQLNKNKNRAARQFESTHESFSALERYILITRTGRGTRTSTLSSAEREGRAREFTCCKTSTVDTRVSAGARPSLDMNLDSTLRAATIQ
ncbi:hypothetical protein EXIGLDRAFT_74556 [Exidia glandulosa HHB12029]|uniref:Uncharacterized protein n=1 Tax=Exidia glandulosa HHB12029 TaxID=1314781 RepID=A0A166MIN5_EXIGL|nr:hypothetical protein EXIGLDRAFT_74556 [Exidia glandulosa HHB12029]